MIIDSCNFFNQFSTLFYCNYGENLLIVFLTQRPHPIIIVETWSWRRITLPFKLTPNNQRVARFYSRFCGTFSISKTDILLHVILKSNACLNYITFTYFLIVISGHILCSAGRGNLIFGIHIPSQSPWNRLPSDLLHCMDIGESV